jgi:alpha-L-fucosidase 2
MQTPPPANALELWYRQPATAWTEALPIGNGRLGAMVFGDPSRERLQLNEDTLWAGGPYDPVNPEAREALPRVRRLIADGRYREAHALIGERMLATPLRQMPYQPVGDLWLTLPDAAGLEGYRRALDLDRAITTVRYTAGGVTYTREAFASAADDVIVVRLTADRPGAVAFTASLTTPQQASVVADGADGLVLRGTNAEARGIKGALRFEARIHVAMRGGGVRTDGARLVVTGADEATLLVAMATSYRSYKDVSGDPAARTAAAIDAARRRSVDELRDRHVANHQRLFRRLTIDLGTSAAVAKPTDERVRDFAAGGDPQLAALYVQYARYLLISCSRPGSQPATLQGLWNESMAPPWDSKYTININTEMNYWPAEVANLAELTEPLFALIKDIAETGAATASRMYGARGWVAHHNTDLWRATAPVDGPRSGMWPCGGAWLTLHLWDHYDFGRDRAFLAGAYPIMKGASAFFLDALVEDPGRKVLVTSPSLSPENQHPFGGTSIVAGPSMDTQIVRELFTVTMRAAEILDLDAPFRRELETARGRLAPPAIGQDGQLQEWLADWDHAAPEPRHRHTSHLFAVFPAAQITARGTPALADAARRTLDLRGDDATGWALGWRINLWARLLDPVRAHRILELLIRPDRTYPNLFDAHPPFQIDGNFGGAAGILEMLVQSHGGEIAILPALPAAWPDGSVTGVRLRGGFEIDLTWRRGVFVRLVVRSAIGGTFRLRIGDAVSAHTIPPGDFTFFQPSPPRM